MGYFKHILRQNLPQAKANFNRTSHKILNFSYLYAKILQKNTNCLVDIIESWALKKQFHKETSFPIFGKPQKLISNAELLTKKGTYWLILLQMRVSLKLSVSPNCFDFKHGIQKFFN